MIRQRHAAAAAALAALLVLACRDAPVAPVLPWDNALSLSVSDSAVASDSAFELPGPAEILSAWTEISFYDGRRGGQAMAEFRVGMEYYGNRAAMITSYDISGDGYATLRDKIVNNQDSYYVPWLRKRFEEIYGIPTNRNCGLLITARTEHQAWWFIFIPSLVNYESPKAFEHTAGTPLQIEPCDPDAPADSSGSGDGGGDGGSGYRWIDIETCYYWAHYLNGVLVSIEFRYCEVDVVPIADQ